MTTQTLPDFLLDRLGYLRRLPDSLGDTWLSQGACTPCRAPEKHVTELAISLLIALHVRGVPLNAQNLILGPLFAGGVSLELRLSGNGLIVLALANDGTAEYKLLAEDGGRSEGYASAAEGVRKFVELLLSCLEGAQSSQDGPDAPKAWAWLWEHFNTTTGKVVQTGVSTSRVQPSRHVYYADKACTEWIGTRVVELSR